MQTASDDSGMRIHERHGGCWAVVEKQAKLSIKMCPVCECALAGLAKVQQHNRENHSGSLAVSILTMLFTIHILPLY